MKNCRELGGCHPPWPTCTASTDNALLNLHNSSKDTQPHSVIFKILIFFRHNFHDCSLPCVL